MNDRHSDHALIDDALAREIEDALDVEPSPHFAARVMANKPARRSWAFGWTFAVGVSAAAAAVLAAVLVLPGRGARTAPAVTLQIATLPPVSAAPSGAPPAARAQEPRVAPAPSTGVARVAGVVPAARRTQPAEPEILIAKDESAALQRLMRGISRGVVDPASLLSGPTAASTSGIAAVQSAPIVLAPLPEISPVALEPLGTSAR